MMNANTGTEARDRPNLFDRDPFSIGRPELTEWPRRLLYVPKMRSYERQTGNIYGGVQEPRYNTLLYTWDWWQISNRTGQAIQIEGVRWAVPTTNPATVLQKASWKY